MFWLKEVTMLDVSTPFPMRTLVVVVVCILVTIVSLVHILVIGGPDATIAFPCIFYTFLFYAWIATTCKAHGISPVGMALLCYFILIVGIPVFLYRIVMHPVKDALYPVIAEKAPGSSAAALFHDVNEDQAPQVKAERFTHNQQIIRSHIRSYLYGFSTLLVLILLIIAAVQ